jgi:hypothetical protein
MTISGRRSVRYRYEIYFLELRDRYGNVHKPAHRDSQGCGHWECHKGFFSNIRSGGGEEKLRRDAWKWENCLHATRTFRGSSLRNPCFDIHYNSRLEGRNFTLAEKLPYALAVTVRAKGIADFYDQVVRKYGTQLESLRLVVEIPIRT